MRQFYVLYDQKKGKFLEVNKWTTNYHDAVTFSTVSSAEKYRKSQCIDRDSVVVKKIQTTLEDVVLPPEEDAHFELVKNLVKPGAEIWSSIKPRHAHLVHMAMGISGEVGELVDSIKKSIIYEKKLDTEHLTEELGDIEFYLEGLRQGLNITRKETIDNNIAKLSELYAEGKYSNQQANDRADKST